MPREIGTILHSILDSPHRDIEWMVDIIFPSIPTLRLATAPLELDSYTYTNDVEDISEIRQTLENPTDQVSISLQNKEGVLATHVINNRAEWQKAEAVIGRVYSDTGSKSEWIEMFRGAIQKPEISDLKVEFEVITDTLSQGRIVANRNLGLPCQFIFKDAKTCSYSGGESTCNHQLKSKGGCSGRDNEDNFGGMESKYDPDSSVPGTGGNIDTGGGGGGPIRNCPRLDQVVLVKTSWEGNQVTWKSVLVLSEYDRLFNPIDRKFHKIRSLEIIRNVPIYEIISTNGAVSYSSESHKILRNRHDKTGDAVSKFQKEDDVLTVSYLSLDLIESKIEVSQNTKTFGDVMRIEMESGHIFCVGDEPSKFIVAHNSKNPYEIVV